MQTEPVPPAIERVEPSIERLRFGAAIRAARRHAHKNQAEVALAMNVSRRLVSAWECGHSVPDVSEWVRLAGILVDPQLLDLRPYAVVVQVPGWQPSGPHIIQGQLFRDSSHLALVT